MTIPLKSSAKLPSGEQAPRLTAIGANEGLGSNAGSHHAYGLQTLLAIEDRIRAAESENELIHLIANETRKLVAARQVLVFRANAKDQFRVAAVSSVALVDRDTPFVRWTEGMVESLQSEQGLAESVDFELPAFTNSEAAETKSYPFAHFLWQPLKLRTDDVIAGLLLARERPWSDAEKQLLAREASVFVTFWQSLCGVRKLRPAKRLYHWIKPILVLVLLAASVLPVPMTTLAPVEIVAANPHRVTAPIDGVVRDILVEPNNPVRAGQRILLFDDTILLNRFKVADREMKVAKARYERAQQAAFSDETARHELAITLNEFRLKRAERNYRESQLEKAVVKANRDGVLIYADKDRLVGRPVKTGERLMHVADPNDIAARIDLSVADAFALETGTNVRLFMDANPLTSFGAKLKTKAYHAEPNSKQQLVYKLFAGFGERKPQMRIGARGTAQLYGEQVPLIYFLLRRPLAAVRQYLGL